MTDLRAVVLGAAAWTGALATLLLPRPLLVAGLGLVVVVSAVLLRRRRGVVGWLAVLVALLAVCGSAALQQHALSASPVAELGRERAVVLVELEVESDPRAAAGRFGPVVVLRATVHRLAGRGQAWALAAPVVVVADGEWAGVVLGERVRASGRLAPADGDAAALLTPTGAPERVSAPEPWWDAAAALRGSVRAAVADRGADERELVPALVDGDDSGITPGLAEDFRTTGLTHLLAVSGTNLTIVVGSLLVLGRGAGVRGRWVWALGAAGIVGFVLLARSEPSVVRAAAMGTVALVGMGTNGRSRGLRCLGVAVLALLLVEPWLAVTPGFALSVLATAGILLLAPPWRDAISRWAPRWVGESVAVPFAAQVACTPVVAGLSGQVSLVAVAANLLVAPAVAPATVLGLAGGVVGLVWSPLGEVVAAPGAWAVGWIVAVARRGAALPVAAVDWGDGPVDLAVLTALCAALAALAPRLLAHPVPAMGCSLLLAVVVLVRPPSPGWPPRDWVMVACDVGQGDALVLRAGAGSAVVVDAGPDPGVVDRCLGRLGVRQVPLVVLTHFHADHVGGLAGVLDGRAVGTVEATSVGDPAAGVAEVRSVLGHAPVPAAYGVTRRVGDLDLQVLWPPPGGAATPVGDGSAANDASVVLLVEVAGVRVLLTGDVEPRAQAALGRLLAGLEVDVLKVPHHGSRHQDLDLLTGLRPRLALVSVGADNDYGHPAPGLLVALEEAGAEVRRTDLDGDLAVVVDEGGLSVASR